MIILHKLMEIKDLTIYIDVRNKQLDFTIKKTIKQINEKTRQRNLERLLARKKELNLIKKYLNSGRLKKQSIQIWRDNKIDEQKQR
jgi:hypothetical protein